ncbi:hypothetical protein DRN76_04735, partial [Methanosarcinales archaeon]
MFISAYHHDFVLSLETLLNDFDAIPSVLQKCITEKIIPDSGRLTCVYAGWFDRTDRQSMRELLSANRS